MTQIEKEYAAALFMLAAENGCEKEISGSLAQVSEIFLQIRNIRKFCRLRQFQGRNEFMLLSRL